MSNQLVDNQESVIEIPSFGTLSALNLNVSSLKEAEARLLDAKTVSPVTYLDMEHCFNRAYMEIKRNLGAVQFQIVEASKLYERAKASILLDKWPEVMREKKLDNNQDNRKAFISLDPECSGLQDRIDELKALEVFFEGKIKMTENVCRYMRKAMDLVLRSGIDPKIYNTIKK